MIQTDNETYDERQGMTMMVKFRWLVLVMSVVLIVSACGSSDEAKRQKEEVVSTTTYGSGEEEAGTQSGAMKEEGLSSNTFFSKDNDSDLRTFTTPSYSGESYEVIEEEGYASTFSQPLSTFSIDVDTASYSNVRRYLNDHRLPPKDAVKVEEMVNYFTYDYPQPEDGEPFSINTEIGPCPWNEGSYLAMIGLQGLEIEEEDRPKTNLVFLMDVSGSMDQPDKLPLLKEAFSLLTQELGENDRVSIVVYAGASGVVLSGATGDDQGLILEKIEQMDAGGSTGGSEGIQLAYELALKHFVYNGNNRVILATDGDFNVGITSIEGLESFIEEKREEGIFLSVLGFGTGNTDFYTMETLADKGNGHFAYIDSVKEAEKVLVEELTGTLYTIAKDVKVQVEFNPNIVKSYRLVGYENRRLDNEDFNNDQVDAGDIGAGHSVTALYEINFFGDEAVVDDLRYQSKEVKDIQNEVMYVKLRYKHPKSDTSQKIEVPVKTVKLYEDVSGDFIFASSVAEFALLLRQSEYRGHANFDHIYQGLKNSGKVLDDDYKFEFLTLVSAAERLVDDFSLRD